MIQNIKEAKMKLWRSKMRKFKTCSRNWKKTRKWKEERKWEREGKKVGGEVVKHMNCLKSWTLRNREGWMIFTSLIFKNTKYRKITSWTHYYILSLGSTQGTSLTTKRMVLHQLSWASTIAANSLALFLKHIYQVSGDASSFL